jgi:lipopolysaccharide/colanic/teichoic acid biosynthesis glycosyltransferase
MRNDPRMTRIGKILRRTSLDELPQIFNVLRGEMALIGPRPALPDELDRYDNWARRRLDVKPGITGLWQVSGRSDLPWDAAIHLDLEYVDNWAPMLDLRIAARTVGAVIGSKGAY